MRSLILLVALSQASESLLAQREPVVAPGSRVRVRELMESGRLSAGIQGRVDRVWGDSMSMSPSDGGPSSLVVNTPGTHVLVWSGRRSSIPRGLVLGAVIVIGTGLILLFPVEVTRFLPGELIPAAKLAHGNEGLMAFLVVILWHIYNAHLNPDVFPFDTTIFTGKISAERMRHEHSLEYDRIKELE